MKRVAPPGGQPPPTEAWLDGTRFELGPLAELICDRYYEAFPDEHDRYGAVGVEWCRHDNRYLMSWAVLDVEGFADLNRQALWLARVLHHRDFPVERLIRNIEIAADVAASLPHRAEEVADRLRGAAAAVADALATDQLTAETGALRPQ